MLRPSYPREHRRTVRPTGQDSPGQDEPRNKTAEPPECAGHRRPNADHRATTPGQRQQWPVTPRDQRRHGPAATQGLRRYRDSGNTGGGPAWARRWWPGGGGPGSGAADDRRAVAGPAVAIQGHQQLTPSGRHRPDAARRWRLAGDQPGGHDAATGEPTGDSAGDPAARHQSVRSRSVGKQPATCRRSVAAGVGGRVVVVGRAVWGRGVRLRSGGGRLGTFGPRWGSLGRPRGRGPCCGPGGPPGAWCA
jgi:hypothetical protein